MDIKLDVIDKEILQILQKDAKANIKDIADQLHLTKTPVYERIKRLEKEGFIKNYVAVLDRDKIAKSISVYCFITLEAQKDAMLDAFQDEIQQYDEITECYVVGGDFDFLLKLVVRDLDAYYNFAKKKLASISHVGSVKSAFVLNESKYTNLFPLL